MEKRQNVDDDRIQVLEKMVKEATEAANETEKKYEEVLFYRFDNGFMEVVIPFANDCQFCFSIRGQSRFSWLR